MRSAKKVELAWNTLVHSKLRSWLTIIGIIIGIASVVAIVSISNGAQSAMEANLENMGTDQITISPGFSRAMSFGGGGPGGGEGGGASSSSSATDEDDPELTSKDVLAVFSVDNVETVAEKISSSEEVIYSSKKADVTIVGLEPEDFDIIADSEASEGRILNNADTYSAVIGSRVADGVFEGIQINRQLTINGKTFRVVGILEDGGNSIYIPISSAIGVLEDKERDVYDSLTVIVEDADLVENTTEDIEAKLMLSRGILSEDDIDFSVSNMLSMQEEISSSLDTLALFLGSIAAISLLVGGIGIANTLFTSVLEKTKEIGILKAIGAKNKDIMHIFLINSGMIGFVGGFGGIIVGSIASVIIGSVGGLTTTTGGGRGGLGGMFSSTALSWELILFALFFSIIIGMIAGAIPAYRASKLKPVDALRYE